MGWDISDIFIVDTEVCVLAYVPCVSPKIGTKSPWRVVLIGLNVTITKILKILINQVKNTSKTKVSKFGKEF